MNDKGNQGPFEVIGMAWCVQACISIWAVEQSEAFPPGVWTKANMSTHKREVSLVFDALAAACVGLAGLLGANAANCPAITISQARERSY